MNEFESALDFAYTNHKNQKRKCGLPYICHPLTVLSLISSWGIKCQKTWSVAVCHDVLEDCPGTTFDELCDAIGEENAKVVDELTFRPYICKKHEYMASFDKKTVMALVVKVADRCSNTSDFLTFDPSYAKKYWEKARSLFDVVNSRSQEIAKVYGKKALRKMLEHCEHVANQIQSNDESSLEPIRN